MLINTSCAWVAVQVFQLVLLYKLMVENKIKTHTRKTKHALENYGWISSTVHVYKHREANINKNISRTFPATMPRLGTNKKDIILYNFA